MTLNELENQIYNYLISRKVKNPNIRMNAYKKIRDFIEKTGAFLQNDEVNLHSEREKFISQYLEYKKSIGNSENLNGAEKHVIKKIYDYAINN